MEPTRAEEWLSEGGWLVELLLPRTDAGVAFQLIIVLTVSGLLLWRVWGNKDLRFFLGACTFFLLGLFALRAAH
jgi:hypothetical protein